MSVNNFEEEYFVPYEDNKIRENRYENEIIWISKYLSDQKKVLDFGCGTGGMLEKLRSRNFDVTGCDVSKFALKKCKEKKINFILLDKNKSTQNVIEGKFDLIIFRGVFQHLATPNLLFKDIVDNNLNDNGLIAVLATPNIDSIVYRLSKNLPALSKDMVANFPSKKIIKDTLEANKMSVIDYRFPYFRTGYDRWVEDIINFMKITLKIDSKLPNFPGNMVDILAKKFK
jgi:2-polyprenyl-3-methyl-5-hydroxy-6-metoxy-1,4-benzoquinol methylase